MSDWVPVPEKLLAAVGNVLAPFRPSNGTTDVPRALLTALVDYLDDDLGCDHNVNICMCDVIDVVGELRLALDGRRTCTQCGGEGIGYDPVKAEADKKLYDPDYGYYAADTAGLIKCPGCDGNGTVPVTDEETP